MFDSLLERLLAAALFLGIPLSFAIHGYDFGYYWESLIFPDSADWQRIVLGATCVPPFFVMGGEAVKFAISKLAELRAHPWLT